MWAIVNGEVSSTFYDGKGAKVKESFKKQDGSTGEQYYSVFFQEPHGLEVGSTGKFSGFASSKAEEYPEGSGSWWARTTLNNARFEPQDEDF